MNEQQQKILEEVLLDSIRNSLIMNNHSYLSLIKISTENNIFFPELYLTFFSQALHNSFYSDYFYVIENYNYFLISIIKAGELYYHTWLYESENFINNQIQIEKYNKEQALCFLSDKLQFVLKLGIPFPEEFNNDKNVLSIVGEENFKLFKRINRNNINKELKNSNNNNE